nr:PDDEXK nuclease domain-containing protein [Pseudomonas sp. MWU12-2345]
MIELYWQVGAYISHKLEQAEWGDAVVSQLAEHLARTQPGLRGFTRRNLFRMRQFYETYRGDEKVSALLTQLPWTHNLLILGQSKHPQEREFYLRLAIQEKWSTRELERQLKAALFERSVTQPAKVSAVLRQSHPDALDFYLEALDRNERKPHENPAIGVLLCASKDDEVVEYALNRSLSPALIAEYQTRLPDKQLLQAKLHEFYALNTSS